MDLPQTPLAKVAAELTGARITLSESNAQDARVQRDRFEALLGEFIDCKGAFERTGGVCNLLTTIGMLCEERSKLEGDEWETAAQACDECSDACDLKYDAAPHVPKPPSP